MRKAVLKWFGPYAICDLLDAFKIDAQNRSPSHSEQKFPALKEKGVYMYLRPDLSTVTYIGKSESKGSALRKRIRHEILHERYATLARHMKEKKIDKVSLMVKVAHMKGSGSFSEIVRLTTIESALIFEMHPEIPDRKRKRFRPDSIEIHNTGCFKPLPETIIKVIGESYQ